jgi:hypothetical protein
MRIHSLILSSLTSSSNHYIWATLFDFVFLIKLMTGSIDLTYAPPIDNAEEEQRLNGKVEHG